MAALTPRDAELEMRVREDEARMRISQWALAQPSTQPGGATQTYLGAYLERASDIDLLRRISSLEDKITKLEQYLPPLSTVTIYILGAVTWKLKTPISVSVEHRASDEFVACLYDIDLYGYGDTIPDAIDDLKISMVSKLEYLLEREGKIAFSEPVNTQFNLLKEMLVKRHA
jgi:hypothetical protein